MVVVESGEEAEEELGFLASWVSSVGGSGVVAVWAWDVVDVKRAECRGSWSRNCGLCLVEERRCLVIVPLLRTWTGLWSQVILNWVDRNTPGGINSLEDDRNQ